MEWIVLNWQIILEGLAGVVVVASIIAKLTPSKVDDAWVAKILKIVDFLALNTKPVEKR